MQDAKHVLRCNTCPNSILQRAKAIVTKQGDLKGYVTVWYHPKDIVSIFSLYRVAYESHMTTGFVVHKG